MLVGFIGSPCSGKTTVASKLFAELKDMGLPTDYVAEQARFYIANKRFLQRKNNEGEEVVLNDEDQLAIARQQFRHELVMSDPRTILITDSSVLNSLLYMSDEFRTTEAVQSLAKIALGKYDILFTCHPVQRPTGLDPNRIHDEKASLALHEKIETVWKEVVGNQDYPYLIEGSLVGPSRTRHSSALGVILEHSAKRLSC